MLRVRKREREREREYVNLQIFLSLRQISRDWCSLSYTVFVVHYVIAKPGHTYVNKQNIFIYLRKIKNYRFCAMPIKHQ